MLILYWDVEHSASARSIEPFVTIADKEVRVEFREVKGYLTDTMSAIDQRKYVLFSADVGKSFKWQTDTG